MIADCFDERADAGEGDDKNQGYSVVTATSLLSDTDREDALARAYVAAVAAAAGFVTAMQDFDRDGVDLQIRSGGSMRPSLDIQLKATINLGMAIAGEFRYPLKRRNYDLLRGQCMVPRILVVLSLHRTEASRCVVTEESLIVRHSAYWISLRDAPETDNLTAVTISLPARNRFDIDGLVALMEAARTGTTP